jgi:hypothetical protein
MDAGLEFSIIYTDEWLVEIRVRASNDRYAGETSIYQSPSGLKDLGETLAGFPKQVNDERKFELGSSEDTAKGNGIRLHFRCIDAAGHIGVDVTLYAHPFFLNQREFASFFIPLEPAAIDDFVRELRNMNTDVDSSAFLRGAIKYS